jgi:hypothetical protein
MKASKFSEGRSHLVSSTLKPFQVKRLGQLKEEFAVSATTREIHQDGDPHWVSRHSLAAP